MESVITYTCLPDLFPILGFDTYTRFLMHAQASYTRFISKRTPPELQKFEASTADTNVLVFRILLHCHWNKIVHISTYIYTVHELVWHWLILLNETP